MVLAMIISGISIYYDWLCCYTFPKIHCSQQNLTSQFSSFKRVPILSEVLRFAPSTGEKVSSVGQFRSGTCVFQLVPNLETLSNWISSHSV